ncbi:hypothetical protein DSP71_12405 [Microbacterium sp. H6]|nr:hypothetical protein DSP71_12405 [Microbacterium sp. H6]
MTAEGSFCPVIDRRDVAPQVATSCRTPPLECDEMAPDVLGERHTRPTRAREDRSLHRATSMSEEATIAVAARTAIHDPRTVTAGDPFTSTYPSKLAIQGIAIVTLFANA